LTTSGTSFVLATGLAAGLQRAYAYFVSPDGITWTSFACASTIPVLASSDRPHAVAAGGSSRIVQIVAPTDPDSSTSNERGLIIRNCSSESAWTESTVFVERGSARFQPAIAFRTRQ
ncbi:MAG TPA: hypothetical protein VJZ00_24140, partial [Thermoanaerobaculia bacterium]|nr:hypothetical protein [Thermoanaerobaculia bacterium]